MTETRATRAARRAAAARPLQGQTVYANALQNGEAVQFTGPLSAVDVNRYVWISTHKVDLADVYEMGAL